MTRWGPRISGCLLVVTIGASIAAAWLTHGPDFFASILLGLWLVGLASIGGVVAARRSENPIGWLMLGAAVLVSVGSFADSYASHSLDFKSGSLPLDTFLAWVAAWATVPGFGMLLFVLLLFPTGRLESPTWRWAGGFVALTLGIQTILLAVRPGPIDVVPAIDNPLGIGGGENAIRYFTEGTGGNVLTIASFAIVLARVVVLFLTLRKTSVIERQQMKWFVYSIITCIALLLLSQLVLALDNDDEGVLNVLGFLAIMAGLMLIPVAMGVGILRYRLYDIDRIINRTIVYSAVTGALVAVYAGTVFLAGTVAVGGQGDKLSVAAATLVAAALFRPLKVGVQGIVDRRFYRHKYDAQKTIDAFGSRLREETDLDELTGDLVGVVRTAMQPSQVSLWLRRSGAE